MYRWMQILKITRLDRFGDHWITKYVKIDLPPPGDTGRHNAQSSRMLQAAWQEASRTEGNSTNRAGRLRVSVAKYTILPSFLHICKCSHDVRLLIRVLLRVDHPVESSSPRSSSYDRRLEANSESTQTGLNVPKIPLPSSDIVAFQQRVIKEIPQFHL
jgi:hypothetical protein